METFISNTAGMFCAFSRIYLSVNVLRRDMRFIREMSCLFIKEEGTNHRTKAVVRGKCNDYISEVFL